MLSINKGDKKFELFSESIKNILEEMNLVNPIYFYNPLD